jgi:Sec-independent protein secretion pathway component TatC
VLREWIRLNLLVAVVCGTGVLFAVPVVTALLSGVADWSALLSLAVSNVVGMVVVLPPLVLVVAGGILLWRLGKRRWRRRHLNRPPPYQDEDDDYYR